MNNCKTSLSCGCQQRTASNGASVCANCSVQYEQQLATEKLNNDNNNDSTNQN
jgi:hypothetical protein